MRLRVLDVTRSHNKEGVVSDQCEVGGLVLLGIRSSKGYRDDLSKVNPLHVVLVGLIAAGLLVVGLISLVKWVVGA